MTLERALSDALVAAALPYEALIEATVAMPPHNAPEPDIVVTNEPIGEGPIPLASVALIVEVSDTTLAFDLGDKQLLYARQAVPEYWVADVQGRVMHQMWQPGGRGYRGQRPIAFGAMIASESLVGLEVETDRL